MMRDQTIRDNLLKSNLIDCFEVQALSTRSGCEGPVVLVVL